MLDYDNSAFYYFSITLLSIYLIPGVWYFLSELFCAFIAPGEVGTKARTPMEKDKASKLKKQTTGLSRLNKLPFLINLGALLVVIPLFLYLISLVRNDGEVNSFDPYQVLGIAQEASVAEIKKAYRKLSLKFHPDKNIGNKFAEEMFMKIAKAYEALTDEVSKENYRKYGNPDGRQSLEVSIGLPRILLDNPKVVLVLYLIGMVVGIPVLVGWWYSNSKQYGEKNILYETYTAFYQLLQESHGEKQLPEVMAASAEFRALNVPKTGDNEPMGKLYGVLKSEKLMQKPKYEHPVILRGNLLLHAHMLRMTNLLTPSLCKDLDLMLQKAPELIDGLIEISYQRKWLETTMATIRFSQCIVQGLWCTSHSLLQLPHFTEDDIKATKGQSKNLSEFLRLADSDKLGAEKMSKEQWAEVIATSHLLPNIEVSTTTYVEEEDPTATEEEKNLAKNIYESDLVTLKVTIIRKNVEIGNEAAPVHAPHFPKTIQEAWWVILTDKPNKAPVRGVVPDVNILAIEKITSQQREINHELRFMAPPKAGSYVMDLYIISDCYMGVDEKLEVSFDVSPASELPAYAPHPEDIELDNEPSLFEQVMAANLDESSDEEDEDDKPAVSAASKKITSGAVVAEDVDSDED